MNLVLGKPIYKKLNFPNEFGLNEYEYLMILASISGAEELFDKDTINKMNQYNLWSDIKYTRNKIVLDILYNLPYLDNSVIESFCEEYHDCYYDILFKNFQYIQGPQWYHLAYSKSTKILNLFIYCLDKNIYLEDNYFMNGFCKIVTDEYVWFLEKNIQYITTFGWDRLAFNENYEVFKFILKHHCLFDENSRMLVELCKNKNEKILNKVFMMCDHIFTPECYMALCENSSDKAVNYILDDTIWSKHFTPQWWLSLCSNSNPKIIKLLEEYINKYQNIEYVWDYLCLNESALHIVEKNINKLNSLGWIYLCQNEKVNTKKRDELLIKNIHLFENTLVKKTLNRSEYMFDWILLNKEKFSQNDWKTILTYQPYAIALAAKLDGDAMEKVIRDFSEELTIYVFNPVRIKRMAKGYGMSVAEYMERF